MFLLVKVGELGVKDMRGVKVTFHRTNFWVYGRKMAKADLSYVVQPNQKIVVECARITSKERYKKTPKKPLYPLTLVSKI